jgi:hypothetical protein
VEKSRKSATQSFATFVEIAYEISIKNRKKNKESQDYATLKESIIKLHIKFFLRYTHNAAAAAVADEKTFHMIFSSLFKASAGIVR